jgi:predicted nucleic acid-binding protein
MDLIADTTLLVGLWRRQAWAVDFAAANSRKSLGLPWVVLGEFWHGATRAGHDPALVRGFLSVGLALLETELVIPVYADICARLQGTKAYHQIGQNDLWIAAASIAYAKPLVSRNERHFRDIPGLRLEIAGGSRPPEPGRKRGGRSA